MNLQIKTKTKFKAWCIWPIAVSLILSCVIALLFGVYQAKSVFLGTMAVILPQAVFGFFCFRYTGALQSRQIWQSFVRGEVLKLTISFAIFAFVFYSLSVSPLWFLLALILMQFIQLIINCWLLNR